MIGFKADLPTSKDPINYRSLGVQLMPDVVVSNQEYPPQLSAAQAVIPGLKDARGRTHWDSNSSGTEVVR